MVIWCSGPFRYTLVVIRNSYRKTMPFHDTGIEVPLCEDSRSCGAVNSTR